MRGNLRNGMYKLNTEKNNISAAHDSYLKQLEAFGTRTIPQKLNQHKIQMSTKTEINIARSHKPSIDFSNIEKL